MMSAAVSSIRAALFKKLSAENIAVYQITVRPAATPNKRDEQPPLVARDS